MPNGVWLAAKDADYFFYQENTSSLHRDQIIVHEFGHLIAGHQMLGEASLTGPLAASGDESDAALRRTCYSDDREWEAETLASMILTWAQSAGNSVGTTADNKEVRGLQRLLGGHKGWL
ncbi:putative regulator component [Mycobacteroides abscessus subsp. abscessus]|nr:putative regulator component [Mycobacteroides abscessus subsp. abscessus]